METFAINGLTFTYPGRETPALQDIVLTVTSGEFVTICGKSGCGKTTLLKQLKPAITPHGKRLGSIQFGGEPIEQLSLRDQAAQIGYVMQNPENQVVVDKVWHELAFGLESLGLPPQLVRLRVAEMASFFGIQEWFEKSVDQLSGGQKQLLNLAAVMAMQPSVLILDEPTSQLDPIAASDFLEAVRKINRELGVTILITEHRLDEVLPMSTRVVVMDKGRILLSCSPHTVGQRLKALGHDMFASMPGVLQVYAGVENSLNCPITVGEGRVWLSQLAQGKAIATTRVPVDKPQVNSQPMVEIKQAWFRYDRSGKDVIQDLTIQVHTGQIHCIVGGNGTGKTTTLGLISGISRPYRGKVLLRGKDISKYKGKELFHRFLGVLPQNPQALFTQKTVLLDLLDMLDVSMPRQDRQEKVLEAAQQVQVDGLLDMHPYDLSGGEQQRVALAKTLLLEPTLLLLDEPTKGLDNSFKTMLGEILRALQKQGVTILVVSHDIEFCAKYGDICTLFFNGTAISTGETNEFFSGNSFYTTCANRMSRHIFENAITTEDVISLCYQNQLNQKLTKSATTPAAG